jgi:hypothetical protein
MRKFVFMMVLLGVGAGWARLAQAYPDGTGNDIVPYNVSIGTTSTPSATLEVQKRGGNAPPLMVSSSSTINGDYFIVSSDGLIGIGTIAPKAKLEMNNSAGFTTQYNNGNSTATATINWPNGNKQKITLTAATVTLTFTSPGVIGNFILEVVQDGSGGRTVVWPAAVKWPGGSAPSLTGSIGAVDVVSFFYNGTVYYGNVGFDYR